MIKARSQDDPGVGDDYGSDVVDVEQGGGEWDLKGSGERRWGGVKSSWWHPELGPEHLLHVAAGRRDSALSRLWGGRSRRRDIGGSRPERGTWNEERGTRNQERGARNEERGTPRPAGSTPGRDRLAWAAPSPLRVTPKLGQKSYQIDHVVIAWQRAELSAGGGRVRVRVRNTQHPSRAASVSISIGQSHQCPSVQSTPLSQSRSSSSSTDGSKPFS